MAKQRSKDSLQRKYVLNKISRLKRKYPEALTVLTELAQWIKDETKRANKRAGGLGKK